MRKVIIAGAGISKDLPSDLPSWWEFNDSIVNSIKRKALELLPAASDTINAIDMCNLPVQCVSDLIVREGAGYSYFPLLAMLESAKPNANHYALAEMAERGMLQGIITTNFDTLIEHAFRLRHVPLLVVTEEPDYYRALECNYCILYKIHGTVTSTSTFIDTVTQKFKGLSSEKQMVLNKNLKNCAVDVIGFSGADFEFGTDYIPISNTINTGGVIQWIYQPDSSLHPTVKKMAESFGTGFQPRQQPLRAYFNKQGIDYNEKMNLANTLADNPDGKQDMSLFVENFLNEPHIGHNTCVGYCISLLNNLGDFNNATILSSLYEKYLDDNGASLLSSAGVLSLARSFLPTDPDRAIKWLTVCRRIIDKHMEVAQQACDSTNFDAAIKESLTNMLTIEANTGLAHFQKKDFKTARKFFSTSIESASQLCDNSILAVCLFNDARAEFEIENDVDVYIDKLKSASIIAKDSGNVQIIEEINEQLATSYMHVGEYVMANTCLAELEMLIPNVINQMASLRTAMLRFEYEVRNANYNKAKSIITRSYNNAHSTGDQIFEAFVSIEAIKMLSNDANEKALNQQIKHGNFKSFIQKIIYGILSEKPVKLPHFMINTARNCRPWQVNATYHAYTKNNEAALGDFIHGCTEFLKERKFSRLFDVSLCATELAVQLSDKKRESVARYYKACSFIENGRYSEAEGELNVIINMDSAADPLRIAWAHIELAHISILKSDFISAMKHYSNAQKCFENLNNQEQYITACMAFVQRLAQQNQYEEAIEKAELLLTDITKDIVNKTEAVSQYISGIESTIAEYKSLINSTRDTITPETVATEALALYEKGNTDEAWNRIKMARDMYYAQGNEAGVSKCLNNMGNFCIAEKRYQPAIQFHSQSYELKTKLKDYSSIISEVCTIIQLYELCGDKISLRNWLGKAKQLVKQYPDITNTSLLAATIARVEIPLGNIADALIHAKIAQTGLRYINEHNGITKDEIEQVIKFNSDILFIAEQLGEQQGDDMGYKINTISELAGVFIRRGDFNLSLQLLNNLDSVMLTDGSIKGIVEGTYGNTYLEKGDYSDAIERYKNAITFFEKDTKLNPDVKGDNIINSLNGIAKAYDYLGHSDVAIEMLEKALDGYDMTKSSKFDLIISLCNRLVRKLATVNMSDEEKTSINDKIKELLQSASALPEDYQRIGAYHATRGNMFAFVGDMDNQRKELVIASKYFLKCNSPFYDKMIELIKKLDEFEFGDT